MTLGWALTLAEWLIRLAAVPWVGRRHGPHAAAAWLAVIFASPLLGVLVYWFIGTERLPRKRIRRRSGGPRQQGLGLARQAPQPAASLDPREATMLALRPHQADFPMVGGNGVELIDGSRAFVDRLVADIDAATDHVHLLFYIYEDDPVGHRVAQAVARAAARGVVCRMLLDDTGSATFLRRHGADLRAKGVQLAASLPVNLWRFLLARLDLRNHRKLA
ncbi:MAG: PLDc N-terminal domain-containing protein, partial [Myxococcales bacterium]|nr:PLDc N-terminal domain-containing protein [Myxococcales bacterium]